MPGQKKVVTLCFGNYPFMAISHVNAFGRQRYRAQRPNVIAYDQFVQLFPELARRWVERADREAELI